VLARAHALTPSRAGDKEILDVVPDTIHQRVPVFLGSPDDVDEVAALYRKMRAA
jgi:fructose-1,6-bisphosphatase I